MARPTGHQQYQLIQLRSGVDSAAEKTSLEAILAPLESSRRAPRRRGWAAPGQQRGLPAQASRHCPTRIDAAQASPSRPPTPSRTWLKPPPRPAISLVLKATVETLDGSVPHAAREANQGSAADRASTEARCLPVKPKPKPANRGLRPSQSSAWSIAGANGFCRLHLRDPPSSARSTSFARACRRRHDLATDRP